MAPNGSRPGSGQALVAFLGPGVRGMYAVSTRNNMECASSMYDYGRTHTLREYIYRERERERERERGRERVKQKDSTRRVGS